MKEIAGHGTTLRRAVCEEDFRSCSKDHRLRLGVRDAVKALKDELQDVNDE